MYGLDRESVGSLIPTPFGNFEFRIKPEYLFALVEQLKKRGNLKGLVFVALVNGKELRIALTPYKPMKRVSVTIPKRKTPGISRKDLIAFTITDFTEKVIEERRNGK